MLAILSICLVSHYYMLVFGPRCKRRPFESASKRIPYTMLTIHCLTFWHLFERNQKGGFVKGGFW